MVSLDGELLATAPLTIGGKVRGAARLSLIRRALGEFVGRHGRPVGSVIEGPSLGSEHREYDLGEASGVLKLWLYEASGEEPQVIEPSRLKKWATGNGAATKAQVQAYVVRRTGFVFGEDDFDASDAAAMALLAHDLRSGVRPGTRTQAEVQKAMVEKTRKKGRSRPKDRPINL